MTVPHPEIAFNWVIVAYFFLGGLSAGCYLLSVTATYWNAELKPLAKTSAVMAPIALAIGMALLNMDLGRPERFWRLLTHFNPTSAISWGMMFLSIFFALSTVYAYMLLKGKDVKARMAAYAGLPFCFLVATYTGILLAQAPDRVLWHTALLPVLFLTGGIISGFAMTMLVSALKGQGEVSAKLSKTLACLLLVELGMVLIEMAVLLNGSVEAVAVVQELLKGSYSGLFWGVEIALGAVIPALILLRSKTSAPAQVLASVLILVGIFTMRYIVVIGGQTLS